MNNYFRDAQSTTTSILGKTKNEFIAGITFAGNAPLVREAWPDAEIPSTRILLFRTIGNAANTAVGSILETTSSRAIKKIKLPPIA